MGELGERGKPKPRCPTASARQADRGREKGADVGQEHLQQIREERVFRKPA